MNDTPTLPAVLEQIRRLAHAYGKPFGVSAEKQGEEYLSAFRRSGLPMMAVVEAVNESISLGKRFPPASELVARARDCRPETDGERQGSTDLDTCPSCRTRYFYAGWRFKSGQVHPRLRCACPRGDEEWYEPEALAWQETDPQLAHLEKPRDYAINRRYRRTP